MVGRRNETLIDCTIFVGFGSPVAGVGVGLAVGEGVGEGAGWLFLGGSIIEDGVAAPLGDGSAVIGGKRGTLRSLTGVAAWLVMSLPFTRRSRLPELATWIHVSTRVLPALIEVEKTASRAALPAMIHFPDEGC